MTLTLVRRPLPARRFIFALSLALLASAIVPAQTLGQQANSGEVGASTSAQSATEQTPPAQPSRGRPREDFDIEMQLQLLVGTSKAGEGARLPESLEPAVRRLRSSMPAASYRLGGTFLHRVKNTRPLEVRGEAGALPLMLISTANLNRYTPVYYQFTMAPVELRRDDAGREFVSIHNFRFGMRVPIVTSLPTLGANGTAPSPPPTVVYEDIGINTGLSIQEGQPVVVGTLYTGQEGDVIIVVLTANRVNPR